jgi:hypothetical protein
MSLPVFARPSAYARLPTLAFLRSKVRGAGHLPTIRILNWRLISPFSWVALTLEALFHKGASANEANLFTDDALRSPEHLAYRRRSLKHQLSHSSERLVLSLSPETLA